jgi:hypothetical protein
LYNSFQVTKFHKKLGTEEQIENEEGQSVEEEKPEEFPLNEAIMQRLVTDPEYTKEFILTKISLFESNNSKVEAELLKNLNPAHNLHISASQLIPQILDHVYQLLELAPKVVLPQKFTLPPAVSADSDSTFIQSSITENSSEGIFTRLSDWGTHCPVSYSQTFELTHGNLNLTAIYQVIEENDPFFDFIGKSVYICKS